MNIINLYFVLIFNSIYNPNGNYSRLDSLGKVIENTYEQFVNSECINGNYSLIEVIEGFLIKPEIAKYVNDNLEFD